MNFWHDYLANDPGKHVPVFVQAILAGAAAATGNESDKAYLNDKMDIGTYFSAIHGLSDAHQATFVMDLYDGSHASLKSAVTTIDRIYADALDSNNGKFLMPMVGVIDDPFSAIFVS